MRTVLDGSFFHAMVEGRIMMDALAPILGFLCGLLVMSRLEPK